MESLSIKYIRLAAKLARLAFCKEGSVFMDIVEGKIRHVMESWPLQLVVDTPAGRLDVSLSEDTAVIKEGLSIGPNELSPGKSVRLLGRSNPERPDSFSATEIQVIPSP
jgi:hypothetical protein